MISTLSGISIPSRLVQFSNAYLSIVINLFDIYTFSSNAHPLNAASPTLRICVEKHTFLIITFPLNALAAMPTTGYPPSISGIIIFWDVPVYFVRIAVSFSMVYS